VAGPGIVAPAFPQFGAAMCHTARAGHTGVEHRQKIPGNSCSSVCSSTALCVAGPGIVVHCTHPCPGDAAMCLTARAGHAGVAHSIGGSDVISVWGCGAAAAAVSCVMLCVVLWWGLHGQLCGSGCSMGSRGTLCGRPWWCDIGTHPFWCCHVPHSQGRPCMCGSLDRRARRDQHMQAWGGCCRAFVSCVVWRCVW
jgi:hypothetical protein